jgi:polyisoprenoid-binding protein YceI
MKLTKWMLAPLAVAVMVAAPPPASIPAQGSNLEFDPTQTKVEFMLGSLLHTVHGEFLLKRGNLQFDAATGHASGELVVDAASGNSGSGARDHRMTASILETNRYPEIIFRPDRVDGKVASAGVSNVQLHGMFSIHGAEHEITVPVEVQAAGGQYQATAKFTVPYVKWGMKNPSTLFLRVDENVEITVHTIARPAIRTANASR